MNGTNYSRSQRIGVLVGGDSPERELSLQSGLAVLGALRDLGHDAELLHVDADLDLVLRQEHIDVAFLALGGREADGPVQGLLEMLGVPYTGSSFAATALSSDKLKAKELLRLHNLPTPAHYCFGRDGGELRARHRGFGFPCVVKPRSGAAGVGVALTRNEAELESAVAVALRLGDEVLVERYAGGCEVQVALLDGEVLGAAEVGTDGVLDWATRATGRVEVMVPPRLGSERLRGVYAQAVRANQLFGCRGAVLVDVKVSAQGNEQLLEVDPHPELAPGAMLPRLAHAGGLLYDQLVSRLLDGARLHQPRRAQPRRTFQQHVAAAALSAVRH